MFHHKDIYSLKELLSGLIFKCSSNHNMHTLFLQSGVSATLCGEWNRGPKQPLMAEATITNRSQTPSVLAKTEWLEWNTFPICRVFFCFAELHNVVVV